MALRNQPYLPLYVNDWLGNTRLKMCSANAHGVMINIMAIMHKEENYGTILLKQKFKQDENICLNFASQLCKLLPFQIKDLNAGLQELLDEGCLRIDDDLLICPRMVKDFKISTLRSQVGSKGGIKTQNKFASNFAKAKVQANTVIENEIIIDNKTDITSTVVDYLNKRANKNFKASSANSKKAISARVREGFKKDDFFRVIDIKSEKWGNDPKMHDYLRPETLFGTKFESYLNEQPAREEKRGFVQ